MSDSTFDRNLTFLFTDVEGSTRLWEEHPEAMRLALELHDRIVRSAVARYDGHVFSTAGDSFAVAFPSAPAALRGVLEVQRQLALQEWQATGPLRVRCGIHTGPAQQRGDDYFGPTLNRCARLMAIASGSQVLVSGATAQLARDSMPDGCGMQDLGRHRLKDLEEPEHVFQLTHPDMPVEFPPLRSLGSYATNLPVYPSSFIGRSNDLAALRALFDAHRIVTLVGPGGAGKTRLATHAAADLVEQMSGGVWFVDLSVLTEPRLVVNAIADAVGVEESGETMVEDLARRLDRARSILIMDNCEHLVAAAASVVESLARRAPACTIVATTREPLEVPGEMLFHVDPMDVPDDDAAGRIQSDALELFAARAAQVDPGFAVDDGNVAAIVEICRHLDGIPLAIELAAARLRHLGLRDIADRLDDRFRLLSRGPRTAAARQQTLRGAVDWSHDLLDVSSQVLFRRLSIFAGSFSMESAAAVACFDPLADDDILELLSGLVDRSLVRVETDPAERRRYRLLETLRAYGTERLEEAGEFDTAHRRHSEHFAQFAEEAHHGLRGEDAAAWHDRLSAELDNLRAGLQRSIAAGDIPTAATIAAGCWFHWYVRGHWDEGYRWLARVLELGGDLDPAQRADVLRGHGGLATALGLLDVGMRSLEDEVELRRRLGDESGESAALLNLANALALDHRYAEAIPQYQRSLDISRRLGEEISSVMSNIAWTALDLGDYDEAFGNFTETLRLATDEGQRRNQAWGHLGRGVVSWLRQDLDAAAHSLGQARDLFAEFQDRAMVTFCGTFEAKVVRDRGDLDRAVTMLRDLVADVVALDDEGAVGRWLTTAAVVESRRGNPQAAVRLIGGLGDTSRLPAWEQGEIGDTVELVRRTLGEEAYEIAVAAAGDEDPELLVTGGLTDL